MAKENDYIPFEFDDEVIERFKDKKEIPVHFYNKDGQILIYKKENATDAEIGRLLRFVKQGIYYHSDDQDTLGLGGKEEVLEAAEEGLSDVKLMSEEHAEILTETTTDLFDEMKNQTVDAIKLATSGKAMQRVFTDFENQPDAMNGLVNIIELMAGKDAKVDVERAVKRTVVAMAMKTRGMNATSARDKSRMMDQVNVTMMSALLCDIGYARMQMPAEKGLSDKEYAYVQNHPLMSYLMIAHESSIDDRIKRNVLLHHHPTRESLHSNNYPNLKTLIVKLRDLSVKYAEDPARVAIASDMRRQIKLLESDVPYDEDANILAIASEFASLTSEVPWRPAFSSSRAIKMMVNNSYFTYTDRILREFLDHVSMNLNNNERVIDEGDYIIVAAKGTGRTFFEVCQVTTANRYQSRPGVDRFATIYPNIGRSPKMTFLDFNMEKLRPDPRFAHYELSKDDSRHICYIVDPSFDEELYNRLVEMTAGRNRKTLPEEGW
ncbi:MAG: hypothetical protein KDK39_18530 [Leptospiraceae bacterium]|nr:hypothetical protein [Leptospiraceae bacterium]